MRSAVDQRKRATLHLIYAWGHNRNTRLDILLQFLSQ